MKLDRRQTHRPTQKESRTLPCLNGVWRKKKRFQTAMSAGAHPPEENQDNFAFYRKKKFQILEWWLIIGKFLLRKPLLEAEPFSVRGYVHHNLAVSQCCRPFHCVEIKHALTSAPFPISGTQRTWDAECQQLPNESHYI